MKRVVSISILFTISLSPIAAAQGSFERTFGGPGPEFGYSVRQTADKGLIIVGSTQSFGSGSSDIYLIRTDAAGNEIWTRTYGGSQAEAGYSVEQTPDGGFILAGFTYSFGAGNGDVYLIRTDSYGDTLWARTFGSTEFDWGYSVDQTADGGYVVAGSTTSFGAETGDIYVVRTDSLGITVWARGYGGSRTEYARSIEQTADGGFIIAGTTYTYGTGTGDLYIIKTDEAGTPEWTRTFGQEGVDEGNAVEQTLDGGYIVAGEIFSTLSESRDVYMVRMDASGDSVWAKTHGGPGVDAGSSVEQTPDSGYVITGYTESFGAGDRDVYLIRTDSSGDTLWTRTYGGSGWDSGKSVRVTVDGGYVIVGDTESFGQGDRDVYLIKTDEVGYVGIDTDEPAVPPVPRSFRLSQNFPNPFNPSTTIEFDLHPISGKWDSGIGGNGRRKIAGRDVPQNGPPITPDAAGTGILDAEKKTAPGIPGTTLVGHAGTGARGESERGRHVTLDVFDLRGRCLRTLVDSVLETGNHRVTWDGKDDAGRSVPSGIYLYRLRCGGETLTRKMSIWK